MMVKIFCTIIKIYQIFLGCIKPPCCRFYPSCSEYAIMALSKHGFIKGSLLTAKRIFKCNPWFAGGVDLI